MDVLKTRWTLGRDRPYCVANVGSYFGLEIALDTPPEATGGPSYPDSMKTANCAWRWPSTSLSCTTPSWRPRP